MPLPPFVWVAPALIAGILVGTRFAPPAWLPLAIGAACAWRAARPGRAVPAARRGAIALLGLWCCVGMLRVAVWEHRPPEHLAHWVSDAGEPVRLQGLVVSDPTERFTALEPPSGEDAPERPEPARQVCVVEARHIRRAGWQPACGLVRVQVNAPRLRLRYGDEVVLEGRLSAVAAPGNPGQYDWRAALARQRIHAVMTVRPADGAARLRSGRGSWWLAWLFEARERLLQVCRRRFSPRHGGLLASLLWGERVALDEALKAAFVETGTVHLLVISGFNVGLIVWLLEWGGRLLGCSLPWRVAGSAAGLAAYWVLTGMAPPVSRAVVMGLLVLAARLTDRLVNWWNCLAMAAVVILLAVPTQLFDAGCQLSFGAVASLLAFGPGMVEWWQRILPLPEGRSRRYLALGLGGTCAVWAGLWPILAWYFHRITPVSLPANLAMVPLVSLLVGIGTPAIMLGALAPWALPRAVGLLLAGLLELTVWCVEWAHRAPGGSWLTGRPSLLVVLGYAGLVALTWHRRRWRLTSGAVLAWWLAAANVWIWSAAARDAVPSRRLELTVLDVGHGDSLVVRTPARQTLLVDAGTAEAGRNVVVPFFHARGWTTIDALVLTHPDGDHLGGVVPVVEALRVRRLFTNGFVPDTGLSRRVLEAVRARGIPVETAAAGMQLTGAGRTEIIVLHPPLGGVPGSVLSSNDNSVVLRVARGRVGWLLCGDLETRGVPWLMRWRDRLRSAALKVPHHGSALGEEGRALLAEVRPRLAVISVGRLHQLPSAATLEQLRDAGASTVLTRDAGAVTLRTDGERMRVTTFRTEGSKHRPWWSD